MVINKIIELWKEDKKPYIKESTYSTYCLTINNHIIPYFGNKENLTEEDVQAFVLDCLNKGLSEKTVRDIVVVVKMIQKYAAKKGLLEMIPIDIKYPNSARKKELEIMSKDNQRILFNYLKENFLLKILGLKFVYVQD